jgi:indole-3-glycerol phosphate synthase
MKQNEVAMTTKRLTPKLDAIIAARSYALRQRKLRTPLEALRALASMQSRPRPILSTVTDAREAVVILGQVKHNISTDGQVIYDPVSTALRYAQRKVDAIALFTDEVIYDDGLDDLMLVSRAVDLAVICQDYVLDEYEVVEARAAGASALVLSAAVLDNATLRQLVSDTQRNRMTAIVEVHNEEELRYALTLSPHVISLSSDDPFTPEAELDLEHTRYLRGLIPHHIRVMVMEKLRTLDDVAIVASLDVDAMMVDEHLLDSAGNATELKAIFKRDQE